MSGIPLWFAPWVFMYTKRVPDSNAVSYLRVKESNSSIMKLCWSGFISTPLTPNWIASFLSAVSIWDIGSMKSSLVTMPTSRSSFVTTRHEMSCLCIFFSASSSVLSA